MNKKFDELAKNMAQSVTRRQALRRFGMGVAGLALASLGLVNKAQADPRLVHCNCHKCDYGCRPTDQFCMIYCNGFCNQPCK